MRSTGKMRILQIPVIFPRDDLFSRKREKTSKIAMTRFSLRVRFLVPRRYYVLSTASIVIVCASANMYVYRTGFHDIKSPLRPLRLALFIGSHISMLNKWTRQALAITIKPHRRKMTIMSMTDIVPLLQSSKVIQHK